MDRKIVELRILPPFAIARLGSSPDPMDNYKLTLDDPIGRRKIEPDRTFVVDPSTGEITRETAPDEVRFRDDQYRIRPVAPFLEIWARFAGEKDLVPLTLGILSEFDLKPSAVRWRVHVANIKAYRRTNQPDDRIEAETTLFSDHGAHALQGRCRNFFADKFIPLGTVQYIKPTEKFPEIRLRFTPAAGEVYGPPPGEGQTDGNIAEAVYDPEKGSWKGYVDPTDPAKDMVGARRATNPAEIYAGKDTDAGHVSYGYLDDECDGLVEAELKIGGLKLTAFARVAAGPPSFAPDSQPVRTVADELEQALLGPDLEAPATRREIDEVRDIVRRALETVRLMNTAQMNKASTQRGVGMARMDTLDVKRAIEPISDPSLADSLAIQARHERVLLALESGSLAWFANVLRDYDKVGDLSNDGRRKMPALMRNADGRHLALTRRQVAKVRAAAHYVIGLRPETAPLKNNEPSPKRGLIEAKNLSAQLQYQAAGNSPGAMPGSAISNAFPGLEMDFRNIWKRILTGIELHESSNFVVGADPDATQPMRDLVNAYRLTHIGEVAVTAEVKGPEYIGGPDVTLIDQTFGDKRMSLEWSNALASILHRFSGKPARCTFESLADPSRRAHLDFVIRIFFDEATVEGKTVRRAVVAKEIAPPGVLTQSLCSPWQNDYRECACFYWAATRPDYVNIETRPDGTSAGNNWMERDRALNTPRVYIVDDWMDSRLVSYTDLFRHWERSLRFVIGGVDEDPPPPTQPSVEKHS